MTDQSPVRNIVYINPETDALGIIDLQGTFIDGGLPVPGGGEIIAIINVLSPQFRKKFATRDAHPADHESFARVQGVAPGTVVQLYYGPQLTWTDHGIDGTAEAELHPDFNTVGFGLILSKGMNKRIDSYSGFFENDRITPTGLNGWLRDIKVKRLFLAGLAFDFCVGYTAEDAVRLGYEVYIIIDACRSVGIPLPATEDGMGDDGEPAGTTETAMRARLEALGVKFITSDQLRLMPQAA